MYLKLQWESFSEFHVECFLCYHQGERTGGLTIVKTVVISLARPLPNSWRQFQTHIKDAKRTRLECCEY